MTDIETLAQQIADNSPWAGDYDHDWCFFCYAGQEEYGPKPWGGHRQNCLWIAIRRALGLDSDALVTDDPA